MSSIQSLSGTSKNDNRSKSSSPERKLFPELSQANILVEKLSKKDKENQELRRELEIYKEKVREFEFLIIKASEEVKKKQTEINLLNSHRSNCDGPEINSARQLLDAKAEVAQVHIQLQKEKEINADLSEKIKEFKFQLEKMSHEAKNSSEQLQKGYATFMQKYSKLEKEHQEVVSIVDALKEQNSLKDQTINNAHQIIKKLKEDNENIKEDLKSVTDENTELQAKVKVYKSKCKTLKKNNLNHQEQIRELEKKAEASVRLEKELEKAKDDLQSFIRSQVDNKSKHNQEIAQINQETEGLKQTIAKLKEEIDSICKINSQLRQEVEDEQLKTKTICSELVDREEIIRYLNVKIEEEQRKHKIELEQVKVQASKINHFANIFQHQNELPPIPKGHQSTDVSPFKRSPLKEVCPNSENKLPQERQNKWTVRGESQPKKNEKPTLLKSTPIKFCNTKGSYESLSFNENSENEQVQVIIPTEHAPYVSKPNFEPNENHLEANNQREKAETEQKPSFTIEFLKDQLQKSMDREHFYALVMETVTAEAEARTKASLERLPYLPIVPPEIEGLRMRCEDLEQRYADMVVKHKKSSDLAFELLGNNKLLSDRVEELLTSLKQSNDALESYSRAFLYETRFQEELNQDLIEDAKKLCMLLENKENMTERDLHFNSELIRRLTMDCEKYKSEIKQAEEVIESMRLYDDYDSSTYKTFGDSATKFMSSGKKVKKTISSKLQSVVSFIKVQLGDLEEEKKYLFRKYSELENELKEIRSRENETSSALRDKEKLLQEKDDMIRKRENILTERENYISKMNTKFNELVSKDHQSLSMLNEKEEVIKNLMIQKQNLIEELERLNGAYNELKKQLKSKNDEMERREKDKELNEKNKGRELTQREEQIAALQVELHNMTRELAEKEKEIEQKTNHLTEKDRKIKELNYVNSELNREISDINQRIAQGMKTESTPRKSIDMANTIKYGQSITEKKSRVTISSEFREEIDKLKNENKELLSKLSHLNDLVATNKALENEILAGRSPLKTVRASDENMMGTRRSLSPINNGSSPNPKESSSVYRKEKSDGPMSLFDLDYMSNSIGIKEDYSKEKENLAKIKENINDKDTLAYIEAYKAKTKKVFQKRVKELEMILRYIDLRIRGFNFRKSSYILPAGDHGFLNYDEVKQSTKLCQVVEKMLEKNANLKTFVTTMTSQVESTYIKQHNLTVAMVKFLKTLFIKGINAENYSSLNQIDVLSELENLFEFKIPGYVSKFDQIETYASGDVKSDFFATFEKIEPKLGFLNDFLVSSLKDNYESNKSQKDSNKFAGYREFLASKLEKVRDMESLYIKLRSIIDRNNATTLQSLQENLAGYVQTYHNIFSAIFGELKAIINHGLGPSLGSTTDRTESVIHGPMQETSRKFSITSTSKPYSFSPFKNGITSFANYNSGANSSRRFESPSPTEREIIKKVPFGFNTREAENFNQIMGGIINQIDNLERKSAKKVGLSPSFEEGTKSARVTRKYYE